MQIDSPTPEVAALLKDLKDRGYQYSLMHYDGIEINGVGSKSLGRIYQCYIHTGPDGTVRFGMGNSEDLNTAFLEAYQMLGLEELRELGT